MSSSKRWREQTSVTVIEFSRHEDADFVASRDANLIVSPRASSHLPRFESIQSWKFSPAFYSPGIADKREKESNVTEMEASFYLGGEKHFLLRQDCNHVQEALSFLSSPCVPGGCHPRFPKVNLIQKRRYLVLRFLCVLSFSFSLSLTRTEMQRLRVPKALTNHSQSSYLGRGSAVRRWDMSLLTLLFCRVCMHGEMYCRYIHRVQCKNCAPRMFTRGKILNQRLHLLENAERTQDASHNAYFVR